ncbi:MAG: TonB family protein [Verrucomicrobiaceae bacterium]|nr:TonB family protein [Verrucomicrobiaceae bacterium]
MTFDDLPPHPASKAGHERALGVRCGNVRTPHQRWPLLPSWVLAVSIGFLCAGGLGLTRPLQESHRAQIDVGSQAAADAGLMVDTGMSANASTEALPTETASTERVLIGPQPEVAPVVDELPPEVIPKLDLADLFTVPAAPKIEEALTPDTPRPTPSTRPAASTPRTASSTTSSSPPGMSSNGSGSSGATGGTGRGSGGASSGTFPAPPYPSFARNRRMQGTVYLSIQVSTSGQVSSVQITRSSGYSDLDRYASEWVKSRWKWSTGKGGSYRQPFVFKLR